MTQFFSYGKSNDNWGTPKALYEALDKEFHFDSDPNPINPEGLRENDGLGDWRGKTIWVNPPYSKPAPWIKNALRLTWLGKTTVMLLKSDTGTNWFHDYVLPHAEIRFIRQRLSFNDTGNNAPFASLIAIFRANCLSTPSQERSKEA